MSLAPTPGATFGLLLRDARRAAALTQEELAERSGLSVRSISDLERGGAHVPRRDTVDLIVRALGLADGERALFEAAVARRRGPRRESGHEAAQHNLPRQLTSFVGRAAELTELRQVLADSALLTLTGAGGVGKTRLALQLAAERIEPPLLDGAWLVELAGLADPELVPGAVASVLGLVEQPDRTIVQALVEHLKDQHGVLVLDNCEHLIGACAELVARLLRECPRLQVLATSREPLGIPGEVTWQVPPLQQASTVHLFVERAQAARHGFALTAHTTEPVERICRALDGIPLALELAAARLRALTVEELAQRLAHDSDLLAGGNRAADARHQTLRATIQWSHDLLGPPERVLFRRLSVFAGGWTLSLAESICSDAQMASGAIVDLLGQLVDKSMVVMEPRSGAARYRFLEPIRHYALEQLERSTELATWRARHATGILELALRGEALLAGPDEMASLDRLEVEHDNMRAALGWSIEQSEGEAALRLSSALWRFWERRGHHQEGCRWLARSLAIAEYAAPSARGNALNALAIMHWRIGAPAQAEPYAMQALELSRAASDARGIAWALINLGMVAYYRGQAPAALAWLEQGVPAARQAGDRALLSLALSSLGRTLLWSGGAHDPRAALALEESLALAEQAESHHAMGQALTALGELAWLQDDATRAALLWRDALALRRELRDRRGIATSLERLAAAAAVRGEHARAAWLWGAAEAQRRAVGLELRHAEDTHFSQLADDVRGVLGADVFRSARAAGSAASADDAAALALSWP